MNGRASVQEQHIRLAAIEDGVLRLADGRSRAVLEVSGVAFGLLGPAEREALLAGFAAWLNSLAYPVQVLVRVLPLDLDGYVASFEPSARPERSPALARLAEEHVTFVRQLAEARLLLERRHYVVVPADDPAPLGRAIGPWSRRPGKPADPDREAVARQLTARCDEVERSLAACGLQAHRLESLALAQLLHGCWRPEQARVERLRAELVEAGTLAVCRPVCRNGGRDVLATPATPGPAPDGAAA